MSDRVPPRPDLPAHGASIPEMPAPERPMATWRWWEALLVYLLIMVLSAFAALPILQLIRSRGLANLTASALIALIIVALLVLWLQRFHPGWRKVIGVPRRIWPEVRAGAGFGALLYPVVVFGVGIALNLLLELVTGRTIRSPRQLPAHLSAAGVAVSIAYSLVIAPIHEELFFRGILFRSLADRYGFAVGAAGSGLAFGLIHYVPAPSWYASLLLMGVMVFTGVALAWFYQRRGNIVANMVAHATFNVIGLTLILALR
ncbi:MAG TPA: type II CAAX endopeptidase family protein [Actinomycetota bacterium]|nr:type II CAAX endopeptidase family protein [Actinomycetota bacterium]